MDTKSLCLAVLSYGDRSGYEIKKTFEDGPFSHIQEIGFSSIYPALAKLLEERLVSVTAHAQEGRPDKKVYSLTTAGRMALLDALDAPTGPDRVRSDFTFRMLFAHLLSPRALEHMMDERLVDLHEKIDHIETRLAAGGQQPSEAFVSGYGLAIYRAMATYLEEHRTELIGASLLGTAAVAE
ncbi:MAG: PadR family transcriptional regulator [Alphaproteobacteria bacterium]|jgi:PadR family transcriptional regulator AphA